MVNRMRTLAALSLVLAACAPLPPEPLPRLLQAPFVQTVPACTTTLTFVPVPGETPLWICSTELPWECFDAYVYKRDESAGLENAAVDAVTRPSQPYNPMDRGFGHAGYPALSMSFRNAQGFCQWLSAHTGGRFRLPTEAEWERAARAGERGEQPEPAAALEACAWSADTSPGKTQPVGRKAANALGLHDMLGNAAEWCVAPDGKGVVRGGSYQTPASELGFDTRAVDNPAWNKRDPQIPKSTWWLIDGGFIGLRVVCESPPVPAAR